MGNIFNLQPDIKLIKQLNNFHIKILNIDEHKKLEKFKFEVKLKKHNVSLFTTYPYQQIDHYLPTNFILCKSSSVDEIIKNILLGEESITYLSWDHEEQKNMLYIKDILCKPIISCYRLDLIEIIPNVMTKSCKTLHKRNNFKLEDDLIYFSENYIIDGIMTNFVIYPINKILLLTYLVNYYNILDIKLNILNLYINMLYFCC
jgi:hypothetical protein